MSAREDLEALLSEREGVRHDEREINRDIARRVVRARAEGEMHKDLAAILGVTEDGLRKFLRKWHEAAADNDRKDGQ